MDANELKDRGQISRAKKLLECLIVKDVRCLDAHAHDLERMGTGGFAVSVRTKFYANFRNTFDMPCSDSLGGFDITCDYGLANCPVIGETYILEVRRLILRVHNLHVNRREQAIEFAIATDVQQCTIQVPSGATERGSISRHLAVGKLVHHRI